jgi:hypothetical protein
VIEIPQECFKQPGHLGELLVCEEGRCKMVFRKPKNRKADLIRVDNCVLRQVPACDYLVIDWMGRKHFVELKGRHMEEGLKQIGETIPHFLVRNSAEEFWAFVICTGIAPAAQPGMQTERARIQKRWKNARVFVKTKQFEHLIQDIP